MNSKGAIIAAERPASSCAKEVKRSCREDGHTDSAET
jgi:hypothetical protein